MLRGFVLLSFLATLTAPTAPIRPENASWIPRVILAQSSRASIFFHRKTALALDRIIFEQASAGISLRGTVRCFPAGVRRYTTYIIPAGPLTRITHVRAIPTRSA